ncbi:hypothetical protein D3C87_1300730 [compost metagenome]
MSAASILILTANIGHFSASPIILPDIARRTVREVISNQAGATRNVVAGMPLPDYSIKHPCGETAMVTAAWHWIREWLDRPGHFI